jgi:hypothetical protein
MHAHRSINRMSSFSSASKGAKMNLPSGYCMLRSKHSSGPLIDDTPEICGRQPTAVSRSGVGCIHGAVATSTPQRDSISFPFHRLELIGARTRKVDDEPAALSNCSIISASGSGSAHKRAQLNLMVPGNAEPGYKLACFFIGVCCRCAA